MKLEISAWKLEVGGQRLEIGIWKLKVRGQKLQKEPGPAMEVAGSLGEEADSRQAREGPGPNILIDVQFFSEWTNEERGTDCRLAGQEYPLDSDLM